MKDLNFISPFKKLCITIGNLPTAYIESMSYYEGLTFLVNYLANNVIPAVNNNSEVVKELQDQFVILKNYVDNYFENLDVQEEINNKLDEMADNGELTDIIAQYLGLAGILVYGTVADMKAAENLVEGSKCETYGYYGIGDGGGAKYNIRKVLNTDVINDMDIIALNDNTLIAELIPQKSINVACFGLINQADYTTLFQTMADLLQNNTTIKEIVFNQEVYNVELPITFNINNDEITFNLNGGTIKLNDEIDYHNEGIFTINMDKDIDSKCIIINGNFDGSGNPADFSSTNINPKGGRGMFFINGARYIKADNLNFTDWFYSACIWSHYCSNADITNITGINVGGRSATNDEDARGDALYFGYSGVVENGGTPDVDASYPVNIKIENCKFSSWEAVSNPYSSDPNIRNGCKSGRCGICFGEYSKTNAEKNLYINNCYFYNYQRVIHLENVYNVNIKMQNSKVKDYGQLLISSNNVSGNNITFDNCVISKLNDIIPIYYNYYYIFSGVANNSIKNINFKNCNIEDKYNALAEYGKNIMINIDDTDLVIDNFNLTTDVVCNITNSNIKYNNSTIYKSLYKFDKCNITGGYLKDGNSINYIIHNTTYSTDNTNNITNSNLIDVGFINPTDTKINLIGNNIKYTSDYSGYDGNTTRTSLNVFYQSGLDYCLGNRIVNENSMQSLIDPATTTKSEYKFMNNFTTDIKLNVTNAQGYKIVISNNKFTTSSITTCSDLYGSKCICHNNQYLGYTNGIINYSNATQYNNYLSTDGSTISVIS